MTPSDPPQIASSPTKSITPLTPSDAGTLVTSVFDVCAPCVLYTTPSGILHFSRVLRLARVYTRPLKSRLTPSDPPLTPSNRLFDPPLTPSVAGGGGHGLGARGGAGREGAPDAPGLLAAHRCHRGGPQRERQDHPLAYPGGRLPQAKPSEPSELEPQLCVDGCVGIIFSILSATRLEDAAGIFHSQSGSEAREAHYTRPMLPLLGVANTMLGWLVAQVGRPIKVHVMNPKASPRKQLLGHMDMDTREWFDGILTAAARQVVKEPLEQHSWIVCDGDVDPEWIESLNSVLDDNRLLTLPSGERIQFGPNVNFVFECDSLKYASPATVSRAGMIFLSEQNIDIQASPL
eukprot:1194480-Prorocentrum_minimum.AAC.5